MPDTLRWTREQLLSLPADGNRYELVDGELIVSPSPAPRHQLVLGALYDILSPWAPGDVAPLVINIESLLPA